jgi:hypothetical protein
MYASRSNLVKNPQVKLPKSWDKGCKMKFFKYLSVTASLLIAAPATAVTIDLFDDVTPQVVGDTPVGTMIPQGSEVAANVVGGFRDLWAETNPSSVLGTTLRVENGQLSFSNGSGQTGFGQVAYDGNDGNPTSRNDIASLGLGGIDLTFGILNPAFFFEVVRADGDFVFTATVTDMLSNTHTYVENILGGSFSPFLNFSEFTSNGVDMTNVGSLVLTVESTATSIDIDGALGSLTVVPLPASALLLLGGLGGLYGVAAINRRNRRGA